MNHATLELYFKMAYYILMPLGILLMIWWGVKMYRRNVKKLEQQKTISISVVGMQTLFYMLPSIFVFILFSVPAIYFNHLINQEDYCKQLIQVNDLKSNSSVLKERCGGLDIDELMKASKVNDSADVNQ